MGCFSISVKNTIYCLNKDIWVVFKTQTWNTPAAQSVQDVDPGLAAYFPIAHCSQNVSPVKAWNDPGRQGVQSACPIALAMVPAAQMIHSV